MVIFDMYIDVVSMYHIYDIYIHTHGTTYIVLVMVVSIYPCAGSSNPQRNAPGLPQCHLGASSADTSQEGEGGDIGL